MTSTDIFNELIERYPVLKQCREEIYKSYNILRQCYDNNGKVMVCGNGGSAADADHIVGELMKGFLKKRPLSDEEKAFFFDEKLASGLQKGLPAISLCAVQYTKMSLNCCCKAWIRHFR